MCGVCRLLMYETLVWVKEDAMYFLKDNAQVKQEEKVTRKRKKIEDGNYGSEFKFGCIPLP